LRSRSGRSSLVKVHRTFTFRLSEPEPLLTLRCARSPHQGDQHRRRLAHPELRLRPRFALHFRDRQRQLHLRRLPAACPRTVGSDSLSWDAAGNLTAGGGRTFTWDGENRPASIVKGTSTVALAYAPGGERLVKTITHPATGCTGTRTGIVLTLTADVDRRTSWTCSNGTWVQKTEWSKYPHPDVRITGSGATAETPALR